MSHDNSIFPHGAFHAVEERDMCQQRRSMDQRNEEMQCALVYSDFGIVDSDSFAIIFVTGRRDPRLVFAEMTFIAKDKRRGECLRRLLMANYAGRTSMLLIS